MLPLRGTLGSFQKFVVLDKFCLVILIFSTFAINISGTLFLVHTMKVNMPRKTYILWTIPKNFKNVYVWEFNVFITLWEWDNLTGTVFIGSYFIKSNIHLFKISNRNPRKRYEICSKFTRETPERRQWRRSSVFIINFEHILYIFLAFVLLT